MTHPRHHEFLTACFHELSKAEEILLECRELISSRDGVGETALHYLAIEDNIDGVVFLIQHGAEVNVQNDFGGTPLSDVSGLGMEPMVVCLLSHGATTEYSDNLGETALHHAARKGSAAVIRRLLAAGAQIEARDMMSQTPLHHAAEWGHIDAVRLLLDAGADVSSRDCGNLEPLHSAASCGSLPIAKLLIAKGADVNAWSCWGPPLFMLKNAGIEFLRFMLSAGARLDGTSEDGRTLLHCVAYSDLRDVVEFLLAEGFDPLVKDRHGATAIDEAERGGKHELANSCEDGSRVEERDPN